MILISINALEKSHETHRAILKEALILAGPVLAKKSCAKARLGWARLSFDSTDPSTQAEPIKSKTQ